MTFNVFLLELKLSVVKVESIAKLMHLSKDALCLVRSHYGADYIVTELKSPSRIVRNTLKVIFSLSFLLFAEDSKTNLCMIGNMPCSTYRLASRQVYQEIEREL